MGGSFVKQNVLRRRVGKLLNEPPTPDKIKQTGTACLEKRLVLFCGTKRNET